MKINMSERLQKIPAYSFDAIEENEKNALSKGVDVINFGIGDPDIFPSKTLVNKLHEAACLKGMNHYPDYKGSIFFRKNIIKWFFNRFNVAMDPETEIISLAGSKEGIINLLLGYINRGDYVLVPEPAYPMYKSATIFSGGIPVIMPLLEKNKFLPIFDNIDKKILSKVKVMFLNYPNNPTGRVANLEFYKKAVEFCINNNIILCNDAAYSEITFDNYIAPSIFEIDGAKEIAIELYSFSKVLGIPGWRMGYAIGNSSLINILKNSKVNFDSGQFHAIQYAVSREIIENNAFHKKIKEIYQNRRDLFINGINNYGWNIEKTKSTFYVWVPVKEKYSSEEFSNYLLNKIGVLCAPGTAFGPLGEGYVRFSLTINENKIKEAINRFKYL